MTTKQDIVISGCPTVRIREKKEEVLFHNLYKASLEMPEESGEVFRDENHRSDEIYSQSVYTMEELNPNFILSADSKLLDAAYEKSMEELEARIAKRDGQSIRLLLRRQMGNG